MKRLLMAIMTAMSTLATLNPVAALAQAPTIELREVLRSPARYGGEAEFKPGATLGKFAVPEGANALRMYIQVTQPDRLQAKERLVLQVMATERQPHVSIHDWAWPTPVRIPVLSTDAHFPAGSYSITLRDKDRPDTVLVRRDIVVTANAAKAANVAAGAGNLPFNRSKFKLVTTKSIDDNWKAVGLTSRIKAGSCITLFFESQDKIKNLGMLRWGIFKLEAGGREVFVNQKDQGVQLAEWRRISVEECDDFRTPGNYRIYLSTKDEADVHSGVNNPNYMARTDLTVE